MRSIDLARDSRQLPSSAAESRRRFFSEEIRDQLRKQWRDAARKSSAVYLHLFNESEGTEFYVTGWDGHDTVAALTNEGFRNVNLSEVRGCKVDQSWDRQTPLWAVMEDHACVSDEPAAVTRTRRDPFDRVFSDYLNLTEGTGAPKRKRKIVGESRKFAVQENIEALKWIVAVNPHGEYRAARRNYDLPMDYLPVEVVRAVTEDEAIEKGRALQESGTAAFAAKAPAVNPLFKAAHGISFDMDSVMDRVLNEAKMTQAGMAKRIMAVANKYKGRLGQWYGRVVQHCKAQDCDEAINVLVGAFGMNALPVDVERLMKDWERFDG